MAFSGKVYKDPIGRLGRMARRKAPPAHVGAAGRFGIAQRLQGYGELAAPSLPGRKIGFGLTPAVQGLFRRGPAIGVSQINTIATNVMQGSAD